MDIIFFPVSMLDGDCLTVVRTMEYPGHFEINDHKNATFSNSLVKKMLVTPKARIMGQKTMFQITLKTLLE